MFMFTLGRKGGNTDKVSLVVQDSRQNCQKITLQESSGRNTLNNSRCQK